MIGIDITKISRFENMNIKKVEKFLHSEEIKKYFLSENKAKFLASRWAIKESIFKSDNFFVNFSKMNILEVNRVFKFKGFIITTSTEDDYYIAMVKKEKNEN